MTLPSTSFHIKPTKLSLSLAEGGLVHFFELFSRDNHVVLMYLNLVIRLSVVFSVIFGWIVGLFQQGWNCLFQNSSSFGWCMKISWVKVLFKKNQKSVFQVIHQSFPYWPKLYGQLKKKSITAMEASCLTKLNKSLAPFQKLRPWVSSTIFF